MTAAGGSILLFATSSDHRDGEHPYRRWCPHFTNHKGHEVTRKFLFPSRSFVSFVVNLGDRRIGNSRNRCRSRSNLIRYFFNLVYFFIAQPQLARTHHAIRLTRVPRANNRSGHGGVAQRPRDCDFSRRTPMPIPALRQFFKQLTSYGTALFPATRNDA